MPHDELQIKDNVETTLTPGVEAPKFKNVQVTSDVGIFKNGVQHNKGDVVVIEANAAEAFAANGEVKIKGNADDPNKVEE